MGDARPALEYLVACSDMSLESFKMARMNQAANVRRQIRTLVDRWIEIEVAAGLAGWMLECRRVGTMPPKFRLLRFARGKPHEKAAISSRRIRIAAPAVAMRQQRPITRCAYDGHGRVLALSVDEIATLDDCRNTPQGGVPKVTKPNATPRSWACPVGCAEEARVVVMSVCSGVRAQHEFEFELEEPVAPNLKIDDKLEEVISHVLVESSSGPNGKPLLRHMSHCFAEAGVGSNCAMCVL